MISMRLSSPSWKRKACSRTPPRTRSPCCGAGRSISPVFLPLPKRRQPSWPTRRRMPGPRWGAAPPQIAALAEQVTRHLKGRKAVCPVHKEKNGGGGEVPGGSAGSGGDGFQPPLSGREQRAQPDAAAAGTAAGHHGRGGIDIH